MSSQDSPSGKRRRANLGSAMRTEIDPGAGGDVMRTEIDPFAGVGQVEERPPSDGPDLARTEIDPSPGLMDSQSRLGTPPPTFRESRPPAPPPRGNPAPQSPPKPRARRASRAPDLKLVEGDRVHQYEVIREIGRGGMGRVVLARDTTLGRRVALKFLLSASQQFTERFLIEARTTAQVSHENIVIIHEVGQFQAMPF